MQFTSRFYLREKFKAGGLHGIQAPRLTRCGRHTARIRCGEVAISTNSLSRAARPVILLLTREGILETSGYERNPAIVRVHASSLPNSWPSRQVIKLSDPLN